MSATYKAVPSRRICCALLKREQRRMFSDSARMMINPLFNLSHFSASKEAQFLSKERGIPRTEFHPYLELIRSSEVDPFAPAPGTSPVVVAALKRAQTGQTDMQTAYSLAISNLIQQLQTSRKEVLDAHSAITRMHNKYKRDERNTFVLLLTTITILSVIMFKTDALEDLQEYARHLTSQWKSFDMEWLGNPPSHKRTPPTSYTQSSISDVLPTLPLSLPREPIAPIEAQLDRTVSVAETESKSYSRTPPRHSWTLSRLFWTTPTERAES